MIEKGIYLPFNPNKNHISMSYQNTENTSKHFVMWSGGCDSTLLLYELLDAYGSDKVVAISYIMPYLTKNKIESEKLHRQLFKSKMNLKGPKYGSFTHKEIVITENDLNDGIYISNAGFGQAVIWALSIPLYCSSGDYVYTGAIQEDQLNIKLEEYHKMLEGISGTLCRDLHFREPYLTFTKRDVIERLINYDLYDTTWFCEMPNDINEPCKKCDPCKTHLSALRCLIDGLNNSPTYIKEFATRQIENLNNSEDVKCSNEKYINIHDAKKEEQI